MIPWRVFSCLSLLAGACAAAGPRPYAQVEWQASTRRLVAPGGCYGRLIRLKSEALLCCYQRKQRGYTRRSRDEGRTWSNPKRVFKAGREFENGCWEPAAVQLPSGEIQLYFANEAPYRRSAKQEIAMLSSQDNSKTWSESKDIVFINNVGVISVPEIPRLRYAALGNHESGLPSKNGL